MARIDYKTVLAGLDAALEFAKAEKASLTTVAISTVTNYIQSCRPEPKKKDSL